MSTNAVKPVLFIGFLLLLAGAVMGQPAQSHPLSQIVPIDTDLDMAENSVGNVSELILDPGTEPEGLVLDDLTITHEGRAQKLILDYNNNEWRIEDSSLNMNNNNISGFFGSNCPTGEFAVDIENNGNIRCLSPTTELDDRYVNRVGDSMNGSLDMADYGLLGLNQLQTSGSGVTLSDSGGTDILDIQESGATDLLASDLDGVRNLRFVDSANNDQYTAVYDDTNGYFRISNAGEDVMRIDDSTNNLILPGGGLDMQNSNINNFFGSACTGGEVMVDVNSDGTYTCVGASGEVQDDFVSRYGDTMVNDLNMTGNDVVDLTDLESSIDQAALRFLDGTVSIESGGSGSDTLRWYDSANGQNILTGSEGGAVGIPSGDLNMNGNSIDSIASLTNYYGSHCPTGEVMVDVNNDGTFGCVNVTAEVQNAYVNKGGDTMTGALEMQGNDIQTPGLVDGVDVGSTGNALTIDASNLHAVAANSIAVTELNEGNVDDRYVQLSGDVMNGTLDMDGNLFTNFFGSTCPPGEVVTNVNSDGTYDCLSLDNEVQNTYVSRSGDSMNGTLDMGLDGNDNIDNIDTLNSGGTTVTTGGDLISGGDLNSGTGTVTSSNEMCIGNQCN